MSVVSVGHLRTHPRPLAPAPIPRLAVLCDYAEENWPSMDLVAEMLLHELGSRSDDLCATRICPAFHRRASRLPFWRDRGIGFNVDRMHNRMTRYPRFVRDEVAKRFDVFHLCDHSYSQLLHEIPSGRAGVFCHDLDTFTCLLDPSRDPRPRWFRKMAQRILTGLQKSAVVFYSTKHVKEQICRHGIVDASKLVLAPVGIAPEFSPIEHRSSIYKAWIAQQIGDKPFVLHVGSCIPRKRVDVLLEVFARARAACPELLLVKVSGHWTEPHMDLIRKWNLESSIVHLHDIDRSLLAALYRRARIVLQTSDAEGFGLPAIEAVACGAVVVASDIPVVREVGGDAIVYCPPGDVAAWDAKVTALLGDPSLAPARDIRIAQATKYTWASHARTIATTYRRLAAGGRIG